MWTLSHVPIRRTATRLGLVQQRSSEKAIHCALESQAAPEGRHGSCVNVVWHGRKICVTQALKRNRCVILQFYACGWVRNGRAQDF